MLEIGVFWVGGVLQIPETPILGILDRGLGGGCTSLRPTLLLVKGPFFAKKTREEYA